jgi:hypothetical protein
MPQCLSRAAKIVRSLPQWPRPSRALLGVYPQKALLREAARGWLRPPSRFPSCTGMPQCFSRAARIVLSLPQWSRPSRLPFKVYPRILLRGVVTITVPVLYLLCVPCLRFRIRCLSAWFKLLSSFYSSRLSANDPVFAWRSSIGSGVATPISRAWFANKLRSKYLKSFGRLPAKLSAYSLRRGAATVYTRAGAAPTDVSRALRHKNYETTVQYVGSLESSARRENFTRLAM